MMVLFKIKIINSKDLINKKFSSSEILLIIISLNSKNTKSMVQLLHIVNLNIPVQSPIIVTFLLVIYLMNSGMNFINKIK